MPDAARREAPGSRPGDLGEVLDAQARESYRRRIRDLDEDIADAESLGDDERAARSRVERDRIVEGLSAAYGLAGKPRRSGDPAERARTTVTARIRDAITRIDREHPDLGRHLRWAVRTGTLCVYDPEEVPAWSL